MAKLRSFIGPSYTLQSVNIDCQRAVNLYPQITESQNQADGEIGALIGTPGMTLLATVGTGPIRGLYSCANGTLVCVSGSEVYRIASDWTATLAGTLLTNVGRVCMADNTYQLLMVDGHYGYIINFTDGSFTQITAEGFAGAATCTYIGGYFVCDQVGTTLYQWSGLYDGLTWDANDRFGAESSPDAVVAVMANAMQLWVVGTKSLEVHWMSGSDTLFNRIDGGTVEYGCVARHTFQKFSNTVMWLGGGQTGQGVVWMAQGYQPKRVSNHGVELAIQGYGDLSTATAWCYQENGHAFYILDFPAADTSWVYDISTGQWHERAYLGSDGNFQRHRAQNYAYAYETHVVGDYETGAIYSLSDSVYTDAGNPLVRMRRAPHLSADGHRIFFSKFQLMCRVGSGLDGAVTYASDPTVELRYSDDFGHTWSTAQSRSLGQIGDYAKRVIWRRLGQARNRVFEVRISDPVEVALLSAELDATPGVI